MEIQRKMEGEVVTCSISGEININTSPELRKLCSDLLDKQIKKVVLDYLKELQND